MNIVVIGLGSMGKRRIGLIRQLYPSYTIYGVDSRDDRRSQAEEMGIECAASIEMIAHHHSINSAFVCTSPLSHNAIIKECLSYKWNVFTELNLVADGYKENIEIAEKNNVTLFLSSTFMYREEVAYLRTKIDNRKKWNYVYHIGQYLPDWHPWENYNDFFVGDRRTNGCREILAIELPWLTKMFGSVETFNVLSDKMTGLNIEYNDNYMILLNHENGNKGCLVADVVSPVAVRRLEIYSENGYYQWNGTPDSLLEFDVEKGELVSVTLNEKEEHREGYRAFIIENAYKNEIIEFFEVICGKKKPSYSFEEDLEILELISNLEENS